MNSEDPSQIGQKQVDGLLTGAATPTPDLAQGTQETEKETSRSKGPQDQVPATPSNSPEPISHGYANPAEGLQAVGRWFDAWSRALSDRSVQLAYALVAANWAIFGSRDEIMNSSLAKLSISFALLFLALNLVISRVLVERLRSRFVFAESHPRKWEEEFMNSIGESTPWPSTRAIDRLARTLREVRTWVPLTSGLFFLIAVLQ